MSQADIPASAPAPPPRPGTVRTAFVLQLALIACLLLAIGAEIAHAIRYEGLIDQALRATPGSEDLAAGEHAGNLSAAWMSAVPVLVIAIWLGATVVGLKRGSNVARILTLVALGAPLVLGLVFCVGGGVMGLLLAVLAPSDFAPTDEPVGAGDESAFYDELGRLDSGGWSIAFGVVGFASAAMALLLGIAVAVLLLTGASNRHFRPPWPTPGPAYPARVYPPPYVYPPAYWQQPYWYPPPAPPTPPDAPGPVPPATPPPQQPSSPPES